MPIAAATADAAPPLDPPGVSAVFHGFRVVPKTRLSVTPFQPNSGVFVRPITPDTGLNLLTKAIEVEVGLSLSPNRKRWRPLRHAGASRPPAGTRSAWPEARFVINNQAAGVNASHGAHWVASLTRSKR